MAGHDDAITVYADYVCPFCYLGRQSLDAYQETRDEPLAIDWRPFDLRRHKRGPDGEIDDAVDDGKDEAYFEQVRENVARLREEYDAEGMRDLDELPDGVDSLDAQAAALYVQQAHPDHWSVFDEALYEALWIEGRDIGDVEVIGEIAASVGLDGDDIRSAVRDETLRERLREAFAAAQDAGITGVPTFAYGDHVARGAVPPEHLRRLVEAP